MTREELINSKEYKEMSVAMEWYNSLTADEANSIDVIDAFIAGYERKEQQMRVSDVADLARAEMIADMREAVKGKLFQFQMENGEAWGDDSNGEHVKLQGCVTFQINNVDTIVDAIIKEIKDK